ncbi:MAG: RidA family protein [Pseudomonadota bacterium]
MAKSYNPPGIWAPFGAFSHSVLAGNGQLVFLKGQVALDADGQIVGAGDMAAQVTQVLHNISVCLSDLGGRMSDILSLQHITTDIDAFLQCAEIRSKVFAPPYPVTTTMEVVSLYDRRLLVEITAIAEIPSERLIIPDAAKDMPPAE